MWKYRKSTTAPKTKTVDDVADGAADDQENASGLQEFMLMAGQQAQQPAADAGRQCDEEPALPAGLVGQKAERGARD